MDNFTVSRGGGLIIDVALLDDQGNPITAYAGTEPLTTSVWPGGMRTAAFAASTTWVDPPTGSIAIAIDADQTQGLSPGRYQLLTRITEAGSPVDAYRCTVDVTASPGMEGAPPSYCTYEDLLRHGRSWLHQLQTDDDETGFAEQMGRARTWLEDCGHAHYRVAAMTMVVGGQAYGPRRSGARSTWLQDQFDAGRLMVTDQIREACAKKCLGFICEGQVGVDAAQATYARLARAYHAQADYLASCIILSLDTDQDGYPDVTIDLSSTDPMYG